MEEPGIAETSPPDSEITQTISKILNQTYKLREDGLTESDLKLLRIRLNFAWGETVGQGTNATLWRKHSAKERYISIQDVSAHLFLAVILAIAPTDCGGKPFRTVHQHLLRLENYDAYHVDLKPFDKERLKNLATQSGFSENYRYKTLLQALFPQDNTPRQIEFAYSEIPISNIELLFQTMRNGVEVSDLRKAERERGATKSQFVTALIPAGDKDCCFTVTVGREEMMEGLRRLGLTRLNI